MTILNQKFRITTRDVNPMAHGGLGISLKVSDGSTGSLAPTLDANGTPQPGAIAAGTLVMLNSYGFAVAAQSPTITDATDPIFIALVVEGNQDYAGATTQQLTCVAGGLQFYTDKVVSANVGSMTPGVPLTAGTSGNAGLFDVCGAASQVVAFVGPEGWNASTGVLDVIMPQGLR